MEKHLENRLRTKVKALGGQAFKWVSPGVVGTPDRIVFMPGGRIYFVEMKFGKGKVSPKQKAFHAILEGFGFKVYVISTEIELQEFLKIL